MAWRRDHATQCILRDQTVKCQCGDDVEAYGAAIHPSNGKGHPLFFYQVGIVYVLAGLFANGSEWTGLLLCSNTTQLLNGLQVDRQSLIVGE